MREVKNNYIADIFIISLVLEAPFRFYFDALGLGYLVYLPKLLMVGYLVFYISLFCGKRVFLIYSFFAFLLIFSVLNIGFAQVMFFVWAMMPFFYGIVIGKGFFDGLDMRRVNAYFIVAVTGAILSYFNDMPWIGVDATMAGYDVNISKEWDTYGVARISGFSRVSFNLATQVLILAMFLVSHHSSRFYKFLVWIVAGFVISISTTKAAVIAWILISFIYLFIYFGFDRAMRAFALSMSLFFFSLTFFLPAIDFDTITEIISYGDDPLLTFIFSSFMERFEWMWPDSFAMIDVGDYSNYIFGRGMGGLGAAQVYFEPDIFRAGDNNFVYMFINFGLMSCFIFYSLLIYFLLKNYRKLNWFVLGCILYISLYGIFVSTWEEPFLCLITGVLLSVSVSIFVDDEESPEVDSSESAVIV